MWQENTEEEKNISAGSICGRADILFQESGKRIQEDGAGFGTVPGIGIETNRFERFSFQATTFGGGR